MAAMLFELMADRRNPSRLRKIVFVALSTIGFIIPAAAQTASGLPSGESLSRPSPDTLRPVPRFSGAPVIFAQPETGLAFGAGGIWFHRPRAHVRPGRSVSQMNALVLYTVRGQFTGEVFGELFTDADRWRFRYRAGYSYYPFPFFGLGRDTRREDRETYTHQFPILEPGVLRQVRGPLYLGLDALLERNRFRNLADSGQLITGLIPGVEGGLNVGLGPRLMLDTRDHIFYPLEGYFASAGVTVHREGLGAKWPYTRWVTDLRGFWNLGSTGEGPHVLAAQCYGEWVSGAPPFHRYALLGGPDRLRGYFQGQHRDQTYVMAQAEYRFPIWRFLRGAAFAAAGDVRPEPGELSFRDLFFAGGAGLRLGLNTEQRTYIRFDFALNREGETGFYLQFREAF